MAQVIGRRKGPAGRAGGGDPGRGARRDNELKSVLYAL